MWRESPEKNQVLAAKKGPGEESIAYPRHRQQSPVVSGTPFRLESFPGDSKHFLLGGVIHENVTALPIDSHEDYVMNRSVRPARPQCGDQGPPLLEMMLQVAPFSLKCKGAIAGILKIFPHHARGNAACCWGE